MDEQGNASETQPNQSPSVFVGASPLSVDHYLIIMLVGTIAV